ncbi:hypothetical protein HBDW_10550 [Herbaspirillum sp. DW155]|uniref:hypothetical protein n=1 Tax=Herbaspirillum sp. DW155 TaxID=3095609 RepID=UPI00308D1040|nr:hypothetical protein HBDW_10550 [Herbaspirillum sp. DW155]
MSSKKAHTKGKSGILQTLHGWLKRTKNPKAPELKLQSELIYLEGSPSKEKEKPTAPNFKALYCEYLAIAKDTLDVAWKLAPIALLPPGLLIWVYLRSIHWEGLFLDSAMTVAGLAFLFLAALLLAFAILLQFAIPSLALIGIVSLHDAKKVISQEIASSFRWSMLGWIVAFFVSMFYDKGLAITLLIALSVPMSVFFIRILLKHKELKKDPKKIGPHMTNLVWMAGAMLPMLATSFPLLIGFEVARKIPDIERWESLGIVVICIIIISLLPGFVYLNLRTITTDRKSATKGAVIAGFGMSYVILMAAAFFAPVSSKVLGFSGIYSNELWTFQVREPSLSSALKTAGFTLQTSSEKDVSLDPQRPSELTFVEAYVRYGFGGIKLLCTKPFDPATATAELVKEARKANKPDPGMLGGQGCTSATNAEVREVKKEETTS